MRKIVDSRIDDNFSISDDERRDDERRDDERGDGDNVNRETP